MALPADYISGTITLTNGSPDFTGTGTGWQAADFREGDILLGVEDHAGQVYVIATITGNASGTLTQDWAGTSGTYTYRMRYEWDSSRVSAQARAMVELLGNGNLESIASLTGPGVVVLEGPHSAGIRPFSDFINGAAYDVQVDTLADRAAYDGQTAGFAVLVSDMGDGRSALYTKVTNASGDWSDPAYITGPVGPPADVTVGSTTTLPPGSAATVTPTPTPGGVELDFGIPAGEGFYWAGQYNSTNSYNQDDVVGNNGSTFIAIQAVPAGEMPSGLFPPIDTSYWAVLAARGQDGSGTGDVVGPASAVDSALVAFDGTTGKLIKAAGGVTNSQLANMATARIKGRATAGNGPPEDLTAAQVRTLLSAADYEQGVWTPILRGASTAGSPTYSAQGGNYRRVGNLVFITAYLVVTALGGVNGPLEISGLPFAIGGGTAGRATFNLGFWGGLSLPSGTIGLVGFGIVSDGIRLQRSTITSGALSVTHSEVSGTLTIYGTMVYAIDE